MGCVLRAALAAVFVGVLAQSASAQQAKITAVSWTYDKPLATVDRFWLTVSNNPNSPLNLTKPTPVNGIFTAPVDIVPVDGLSLNVCAENAFGRECSDQPYVVGKVGKPGGISVTVTFTAPAPTARP